MHILQPKHTKIDEKESEKVLEEYNISKSQLPKILSSDPALPEDCSVGDLIKIERQDPKDKTKKSVYFRVVV